jgi:hypothetical protein
MPHQRQKITPKSLQDNFYKQYMDKTLTRNNREKINSLDYIETKPLHNLGSQSTTKNNQGKERKQLKGFTPKSNDSFQRK